MNNKRRNIKNLELNKLNQLVTMLKSMNLKHSQKKSNKKRNKPRRINNGSPTSSKLFTVGEDLFHHSPACQTLTGVAACAAAQFAPFDIARGSANVLSDATPSQKFSSRGFTTISLAAGEKMFGFCCPNIANGTSLSSLTVGTGTFAALNPSTPWGAPAAGVTARTVFTATPYDLASLNASRAEFKLVSHGIRIKCTSNAMNRGGSLIYLVDTNETFVSSSDSASTVLTLDDRMQGSAKAVRVSLASQPVVEIVCPYRACDSQSQSAQGWADTNQTGGFYDTTYGTTLAGWNAPGVSAGYGQAFFVYQNGSGVAQNFDIELVEHWEVIFPGAEQLATPSVSLSHAADSIKNILHQAHQTHANHPTLSLKSVVKQVANMNHNKEVIKNVPGILSAIAAL